MHVIDNSHWLQQQYGPSAQAQNYYVRPREMTREDLGLPLQYDGRWTDFTMAQFEQWADLTAPRTDAPYALWLGANA